MFLILLILIQCLIIFLIHLYFDHLDSKNVDFLSTLQASNLLSVQTSLNTNLVWGVLLLIASFILESNSLLYIKTGLSEILYNNRLYIYIVACIPVSYTHLDVYKRPLYIYCCLYTQYFFYLHA
ncbi:hypothetical protein A5884_003759 [Enterococcus sp. 7D2_DIV0200]|nr:hypothetical protein A5884_003759 [Enterococcus sp. 7D2_DIV0200]